MTLRAERITLRLGSGETSVTALDELSLDVPAGRMLAVLGPSGAGKSSLLAVCGGLRTASAGQVWIGGTEITGLSPAARTRLRRDRVGFVFQQSNLVPALTALEQLLLMVHVGGRRPGAQDRARALALLEEVGMSERRDRRPGQLSGGERQRVGIARAFMNAPEILLVDEPTSMLDRARGHQIVELLARACHERAVATVLVTHDISILDVADRVVELVDGRIVAPAPAAGGPTASHAAH